MLNQSISSFLNDPSTPPKISVNAFGFPGRSDSLTLFLFSFSKYSLFSNKYMIVSPKINKILIIGLMILCLTNVHNAYFYQFQPQNKRLGVLGIYIKHQYNLP